MFGWQQKACTFQSLKLSRSWSLGWITLMKTGIRVLEVLVIDTWSHNSYSRMFQWRKICFTIYDLLANIVNTVFLINPCICVMLLVIETFSRSWRWSNSCNEQNTGHFIGVFGLVILWEFMLLWVETRLLFRPTWGLSRSKWVNFTFRVESPFARIYGVVSLPFWVITVWSYSTDH